MINVIEAKFHTELKTLKPIRHYFNKFQEYLKSVKKFVSLIEDLNQSVPEYSFNAKLIISSISNEFNKCINQISKIESSTEENIIQPIRRFEQEYSKKRKYFNNKKKEIIGEILNAKSKVEARKNKYFKRAKRVDGFEEYLVEDLKEGKESNMSQKQINRVKKYHKAVTKYKETLRTSNTIIEEKMGEHKILTAMMLQYDEERVATLKALFRNYKEALNKLEGIFHQLANIIKDIIDVKRIDDADSLINSYNEQSTDSLFLPLEYEKYPYTKNTLGILEDDIKIVKGHIKQENTLDDIANKVAISLVNPKVKISIGMKADVIKSKELLIEKLIYFEEEIEVLSMDSFNNMGDIINCILNEYRKENIFNPWNILVVIDASNKFYFKKKEKKIYLRSLIASNLIWQYKKLWYNIIQNEIDRKVENDHVELVSYEDKVKKKNKAKVGKIVNVREEAKHKVMSLKNPYDIIRKYSILLPSLYVNSNLSKELIRHFGKVHKIDLERVFRTELAISVLKPLLFPQSLKKHSITNYNTKTIAITLCIPYVKDKLTLRDILLLNKDIYNKTKKQIFKRILEENKLSKRIRGYIWSQILNTNECNINYEEYIDAIKDKRRIVPETVVNIIKFDVDRSFSNSEVINPNAITNILNAYACHNHKVEYCQGMHLIVGLLFSLMEDEKRVFKALVQLMKRFDLNRMYITSTPLLKVYLYQFERLAFFYYPKLIKHFRKEDFDSIMYGTTWFMTLFTHVIGHMKDNELPEELLIIWDNLLLHGVKTLFKTGLCIISELKDKLFGLQFEELATVLGNTTVQTLFKDNSFISTLKAAMKKFKVTNRILVQLEEEYNEIFMETKSYLESP